MQINKKLRHQSKKLRESARGQDCMVRLPGICNFNNETTILAHLNSGGMGTKHSDLFGTFCCAACHDAVDRRSMTQYSAEELELMLMQGMARTQQYWLDVGLIELP